MLTASHNVASNIRDIKRFICFGINRAQVGELQNGTLEPPGDRAERDRSGSHQAMLINTRFGWPHIDPRGLHDSFPRYGRDRATCRRDGTILVYDRGMPVSVNVQTVHPRKLAAVRREVAPGAVGSAWGPALGKVWEFIRSQPGLRTDGHNIFLYHHPTQPGAPILCDFGVEVTRTFETAGEVYATETPGGEAAVAVHRGPYNRMNEAHDAIRKWMAANRRESAGHSWEIYGDPTPDPADTETTVVYLLK